MPACSFGIIRKMIRFFFNCVAWFRPYRSEWVEDLPDETARDTIYVVGGRRYPFQVVVVCPRRACKQLVHLDISPSISKRWSMTEHGDGLLSLLPSVHVTGLRCRCHYWVRHGRIRWNEAPCLRVPKENLDDPRYLN